jgi:hypothetical protein
LRFAKYSNGRESFIELGVGKATSSRSRRKGPLFDQIRSFLNVRSCLAADRSRRPVEAVGQQGQGLASLRETERNRFLSVRLLQFVKLRWVMPANTRRQGFPDDQPTSAATRDIRVHNRADHKSLQYPFLNALSLPQPLHCDSLNETTPCEPYDADHVETSQECYPAKLGLA